MSKRNRVVEEFSLLRPRNSAGRDLPAAIGTGVVLGAIVVGTLLWGSMAWNCFDGGCCRPGHLGGL